jgi:hypothetical protein
MKEHENDCVIKFFRGLNKEYSQVRRSIMMIEPMSSIVKAFSIVLQQEQEFGVPMPPSNSQESVVFVSFSDDSSKQNVFTRGSGNNSRGGGRSCRSNGGGNKLCTHCKKTNHTIDTCFYLHGFPTGYMTRNKSPSNTSKTSTSLVEINSTTTSLGDKHEDSKHQDHLTLSKEQYQSIIALLQQ